MDNEFEEYEDIIDAETEEEPELQEIEHDLDYWAEEAESSDAIPEDESISAELEASFVAIMESELDHEEDPVDFDDDILEDEDDAAAPVSFQTLWEETNETAVARTGKAARKEADFEIVIKEMDRLDQNRMRRERYHEVLRSGDEMPLEYGRAAYGLAFPEWFNDPNYSAIQHGRNLDVIFNCTYELHQFTSHSVLIKILRDLKLEYKDVLFFTVIREMSTKEFGELLDQTDRNIRKKRMRLLKRIRDELYEELKERKNLSFREKQFLERYKNSALTESEDAEEEEEKRCAG